MDESLTPETAKKAEDTALLETLVAASSQKHSMALRSKLYPLQASFAVDTGAAVNVLSEVTYLALKHAANGNCWEMEPRDLRLVRATSDNLKILGIVRLPLSFGKHTPRI